MSASCPPYLSLALDPSFSPAAKAVYLAAFEWIEAEDLEATYARLTTATGLHGSSLQRAVRELEERHLVRRYRTGGEMAVQLVSGDWSSPVVGVGVVEEEVEQQQHQAPTPNQSPETTSEAGVDPLVSELRRFGVAACCAAELVVECAAPRILEVLEGARAKLHKLTNPAGWVVAALRGAWDLAYRPPAASPSYRPETGHTPVNRTDPRPEEKARHEVARAIEAEVDRLEKGLSEGERKALEAEVKRDLPADLLTMVERGLYSMKSLIRTGLRDRLRSAVA